jgi:hypothetical protein
MTTGRTLCSLTRNRLPVNTADACKSPSNPRRSLCRRRPGIGDQMRELEDFSTERLLELREEYRTGRVKLVEREPDAEVRARLAAVNSKMLAAIEAELEKRTSAP